MAKNDIHDKAYKYYINRFLFETGDTQVFLKTVDRIKELLDTVIVLLGSIG